MHCPHTRLRLTALTLGLAALLVGCGGGDALPPGAARNLRHFRGGQPPLPHTVEFREPGEGNVADIEVQTHADCVCRNNIIDFARLV